MNANLSNLTELSSTSGSGDDVMHGNVTMETDASAWRTNQYLGTLYILYAVGYSVIIVFGTIGNILVFIIMGKGSMRQVSTCFYMRILALADTGWSIYFFKHLWRTHTCPFCGTNDTPVLDFWWRLPWVSKAGWSHLHAFLPARYSLDLVKS